MKTSHSLEAVEPENITVYEAEAIYGVSSFQWRRFAYSGKITSYKVGSRLFVPRAECQRIMAESRRPRKPGSGGRRAPKQKALSSPQPQSEAPGADSPAA
jgi:hypothetical protein